MKKRGASTVEHYEALARLVKADGCSSAPDLWFKPCCDVHDVMYRTGKNYKGEPVTRAQADKQFYQCLRKHAISIFGKYILAPMYYAAVRTFGGKYWQGQRELDTAVKT